MKNLKLLCVLCLLLACAGYTLQTQPRPRPQPSSPTMIVSLVTATPRWSTARKSMETHSRHPIHGSMFSCVDCHTSIKSLPHDANLPKPTCTTCHADEQKMYDNGVHGKALAAGNTKVATCESCHGNVHEILPASDPKSRTARVNIAKTCGQCHSQPVPGMADMPAVSYQESVHGRLVAAGNTRAAVCSDCHGNHDIRRPSDPTSPVFRANIPKTCGRVPRQRGGNLCQQHSRPGVGRGQ